MSLSYCRVCRSDKLLINALTGQVKDYFTSPVIRLLRSWSERANLNYESFGKVRFFTRLALRADRGRFGAVSVRSRGLGCRLRK